MNTATGVADALLDYLAGQTFSQEFTISRPSRPKYKESDSSLQIFIVPGEATYEWATRQAMFVEHTVGVGIYKRIDPDNADELEGMFDFTQEVIDAMTAEIQLSVIVDAYTDLTAQFVKIANQPVYDPAILDQHCVFVSVIAGQYRLLR